MPKRLLVLSCLALVLFSSCQKDLTKQSAVLNTGIASSDDAAASTGTPVVDRTNQWYGTFYGSYAPYPAIADKSIIHDGVARLPEISQPFDFSILNYDIPSKYNISGDSVSFEVNARNEMQGSQPGYDIALILTGSRNTAEVLFVGVQSGLPYTKYFVGGAYHSGLQELVHYFDHFQTIKLTMKNNTTSVYIDTTLVYTFKYGSTNRVGRLKTISVSGKGFADVNRVVMRNSTTRNIIFKDEFNTEGKSHLVYYNY